MTDKKITFTYNHEELFSVEHPKDITQEQGTLIYEEYNRKIVEAAKNLKGYFENYVANVTNPLFAGLKAGESHVSTAHWIHPEGGEKKLVSYDEKIVDAEFVEVTNNTSEYVANALKVDEDLKYVQDKLFSSLGIPKEHLGYDDNCDGQLVSKDEDTLQAVYEQKPEPIDLVITSTPVRPRTYSAEYVAEAKEKFQASYGSKCECGAEKARTTHSSWCPKH